MYKYHCCCGAITLKVHADIDATNASPHSLAETDNSDIRMDVRAEDVVVDAEQSVLGCLEIFPGHRQYFCNICANTLYTCNSDDQVRLTAHFSGHDVMPQHHARQYRV